MKFATIILISSLLIGCNTDKHNQNVCTNSKNSKLLTNPQKFNTSINNLKNNKALTNIQNSNQNINKVNNSNEISANIRKSNTNNLNDRSSINIYRNDVNNIKSFNNINNTKNGTVLKLLQNNNLVIINNENDINGTVQGFVNSNEYEKKQYIKENISKIKPLDEKMKEDSKILRQVYDHQNQIEKSNKW